MRTLIIYGGWEEDCHSVFMVWPLSPMFQWMTHTFVQKGSANWTWWDIIFSDMKSGGGCVAWT